jgi:altronate dehydratase
MPALMPSAPLTLTAISRLAAPHDNVAIAVRRLDTGSVVAFGDGPRTMAYTVLEGHRFAVKPIARGEPLLSWGVPFGIATAAIAPGEYVCNPAMLEALAVRRVDGLLLPPKPNFEDHLPAFELEDASIRPAPPVEQAAAPRVFEGYRRPGKRGVGTRNTIVVLGTTSRTASFARQLAARLQPLARIHPTLDGIVAVAHTEGGGLEESNNTAEILRTLAGFMVHPNVGAILAVDYGVEPITNARLEAYLRERGYPIDDVLHAFLSLRGGLAAGLAAGERIVRGWLPVVAAQSRTPEPLSGLRVALQCGGSDAFSGVSGNPLAGATVHELVRHGGVGVLTETDEVMGAESYLLANVRDLATARAFYGQLEAFREKLSWHGLTAESNPSGGNRYRGLYNIALKSLGAVHKKDPRTRLDTVIDFAQPLSEIAAPGFTFMNGPGNDLESIAGEVGAGCNLIIFITGNGSVTNFPFVPTLKITTTTRRHELLRNEMDFNAGRYLDGENMEALTAEMFDLLVSTASGLKSKGEHAGHSQVSLWRNWRQTDTSNLDELHARVAPDGEPLAVRPDLRASLDAGAPSPTLTAFRTASGYATERVGLVLPTSMCSTQVARLAVERLNAQQVGREQGITRFVAFMHTEGCGFGGDTLYERLHRTYRGYLTHPNVAAALLLEHGCEKVPNDVMRGLLEADGLRVDRFGWASVQLDGGIQKSIGRVEEWFKTVAGARPAEPLETAGLGALNLALLTASPVSASTAVALARLTTAVLVGGGSVLLPESDALWASPEFTGPLLGGTPPRASLAYGQPLRRAGLHVVATETDHWVENLTGLAGCGAHLAIGIVSAHAQQGHPLIPLLQAAESNERGKIPADDIDVFLRGEAGADERTLVEWVVAMAERKRMPVSAAQGFVDFQITRGLLGLTT